jgi:hypothetical protein
MQNLLYQLKLSGENEEKDVEANFPFWEQLSREAVAQMKSYTFRDQFYKLVQNDAIHLGMLSVHLFLIAEQLRSTRAVGAPQSMADRLRDYKQLKKAQFIFSTSRFPQSHKYFLYRHFYSHLPEDLFFEDFERALKRSNRSTFKAYGKAFKAIDAMDSTEEKLKTLESTVLKATFRDQVTEDDPVVAKFALYLLAHRNYLKSLPYQVMRDYKVNWGLQKVLKIGESSSVLQDYEKAFQQPGEPGARAFATRVRQSSGIFGTVGTRAFSGQGQQ